MPEPSPRSAEIQPDDTIAAVMMLLRAARLNRYTVQAMGEEWPRVSRFEVIHAGLGDVHARVEVAHAGSLRITYMEPLARPVLAPKVTHA